MWKTLQSLFDPPRPVKKLPMLATALLFGSREVPLLMVRHARARRYVLRLRADGTARVTIPRGGNQAEARAFVERNRGWLENQIARHQARRPQTPNHWHLGTEIWFRGALVRIKSVPSGPIGFATEAISMVPSVTDFSSVDFSTVDLRPAIEKYLRRLATAELPVRVMELAAQHHLTVNRVTVRNQKSRWGSCSRRRTISLNWRLIQTPDWVRDYIILHELAHLRQMNHSPKFWREVEAICPDYQRAEKWLKVNRNFITGAK